MQTQQVELGPLDPSEAYLISSNPFDIVGAARAGMGTVWVDREGNGWADGLGKPKHVVRSLEEVVGIVRKGGDVSEIGSDPTVGRG